MIRGTTFACECSSGRKGHLGQSLAARGALRYDIPGSASAGIQICRPRYEEEAMGWATQYIARLQAGETVQLRPRGNSMRGKVNSGQLCTVEPVDPATVQVGDI